MLVEQLLKALIRVVDAQLLERVNSQDLEAENVQNPNERGGFCVRPHRAAVGVIDLLDDVREQRGVDPLDQRVDVVRDVGGVQLLDVDAVPVSHLHALGQYARLWLGRKLHEENKCQSEHVKRKMVNIE